jgi:exodeoxyribonuclease V alpha subunit
MNEELITVTIHQCKVFAGATMDFIGRWVIHPKYGRQFQADKSIEKKPATAAALEKYLGSGLIKGVGPKTAKKIVRHFGSETLPVFEEQISRLVEVEGIARKKLRSIQKAWEEHREIRKVMMFLQSHGISTLFAVKIFKLYGEESIEKVRSNPYRLAKDFYGIGFFSADKVALSLHIPPDGDQRVMAGIKHVLSAAKEQGHCYLKLEQIKEEAIKLLDLKCEDREERIIEVLNLMEEENELRVRTQSKEGLEDIKCYYSKSLYYDELTIAKKVILLLQDPISPDITRIKSWLERYSEKEKLTLSEEQLSSVVGIANEKFSILTGGPGCGKTTTTKTLVALFKAMKKKIMLAAPTGRAAQRMEEVIGLEAKTIHRLLTWNPASGGFKKNEEDPLDCDVIVIDECSMLDVTLTASLLKAIPINCQVVFIGDPDQLPSVGAGNVLHDLIDSNVVPCFKLTKVFRQAGESKIIQYAHQINAGITPKIETPLKHPSLWSSGIDCMFIDSDEATLEQLKFISKVKKVLPNNERDEDINEHVENFSIPKKFQHVNLQEVINSNTSLEELKATLKKIHPYSSLHFGLNATGMVQKLYAESISKYLGNNKEIQILSPMTRGSLGTYNLNKLIQGRVNPPNPSKGQITIGEKIIRVGDRVIQKRNNYDLEVFNGDIGKVKAVDTEDLTCLVEYGQKNSTREVLYESSSLSELELAYTITIHKSQGSEFDVVIIPLMTQHFTMLFKNLIYTGLTRAKKMAIFIGSRKALSMAIRSNGNQNRQTALSEIISQTVVT